MALTKLPKNAIGTGAIDASKIEDGTLQAVEISGTISSDKIATGTIANNKLINSTFTIRGTSRALGDSFSLNPNVDWQSVIVADGSTGTTGSAGIGYFINTTSAAHTFTLPASASRGDTIALRDYAGTFATNKLTINRNGHNIQGVANNSLIGTNRASLVLVYVDSTKGWLYAEEHNVADLQQVLFITATGGTITTSGDYKIHTFTGDGCFVVSCGGNPVGNDKVDYLIVAGGGGAGGGGNPSTYASGGGGAGGYRESKGPAAPWTASPLATCASSTVTAQTYPVTVGGGGAGAAGSGSKIGSKGGDSIFSTITSTGGGGGHQDSDPYPANMDGGSGGGSGASPVNDFGAGNTPPTSPPQGNNGGYGSGNSETAGGGGGGAGGAGGFPTPNANPNGNAGGAGGVGVGTSIHPNSPSPVGTPGPNGALRYFAGGGGGGYGYNSVPTGSPGPGGYGGGGPGTNGPNSGTAGTINTGGGGGGVTGSFGPANAFGAAGGSGIVVIRYKFQ